LYINSHATSAKRVAMSLTYLARSLGLLANRAVSLNHDYPPVASKHITSLHESRYEVGVIGTVVSCIGS